MTSAASPIWHPFTQHAILPQMTEIESARGAYLYAADERQIYDAISSWWVITHGHCHPAITEAISAQANRLDQVIFAGYTHQRALAVANRLIEITPDGLDYVFFSDSGSTCVEVALKMALSYWQHSNHRKKTKIVTLEHGYHGDTIGAMSVGARGVFNQPYEALLFEVSTVAFPGPGREQTTLDQLEAFCKQGDIAAFIVEPLVLGAGGMLMYSARTLAEMHAICRRHKVLFIADEVMTAWGRTGTLFACEQADIVPDIACYSKGITGGVLPLAVTLCRGDIFEAHYSHDRSKTFFHSSSYTANAIACAAAEANLIVWQEEPVQQRIDKITALHQQHKSRFENDPNIKNVRQRGSLLAMDLRVSDRGYMSDIGPVLSRFFETKNLLLRPLGNTVYLVPPYCSTTEDLMSAYEAILEAAKNIGCSAG